MDLLESGGERERVPAAQRLGVALSWRPPTWVVAMVAVLLVGTGVAATVTAGGLRADLAREAARAEVDLVPVGSPSSTVSGVARGELRLLLVNQQDRRVRLGALQAEVEGLRVLGVEPAFGQPLGPHEERAYRVAFEVPDCSRLVLPGRLEVSLAVDGAPLERRELAVRAPDEEGPGPALVLAACPPSARAATPGTPTDVGVRPAGGSSQRVGVGAQGVARLEVRNDGAPLQLLSVTGEVPGVAFGEVRIEEGRSVETDGLVVVRLSFRIDDCLDLRPSGLLVLTIERRGAVQELRLGAVAEPAGGVGPQVTLPVVYRACS